MAKMMIELPEPLQQQLEAQAKEEGIPLDQHIIDTLVRYSTHFYTIKTLSEVEIAEKRVYFEQLRTSLNRSTNVQIQSALDQRDLVESEPELTADLC